MKKSFLILGLLTTGFLLPSCGDGSEEIEAANVPTTVISAFNTKYPGATNVEWERETDDENLRYEAEFDFNGADMKAKFDGNGAFLEGEED